MRVLTFVEGGRSRVGFEVDGGAVDLAAAYDAIPAKERLGHPLLSTGMLGFLSGGDLALAAAFQVQEMARQAHASLQPLQGSAGQVVDYSLDGPTRMLVMSNEIDNDHPMVREAIRKGLTPFGIWHYALGNYPKIMQVIRESPVIGLLTSHTVAMGEVQAALELSASHQTTKVILDLSR